MTKGLEEPSESDLKTEEAWLNENGLGEGASKYRGNLNSEDPEILKTAYIAWIEELKDDLAIEELTDPESSKTQQIRALINALEQQILILDSANQIKKPGQRRDAVVKVRQKIAELNQQKT